jgi:hypothetical protein
LVGSYTTALRELDEMEAHMMARWSRRRRDDTLAAQKVKEMVVEKSRQRARAQAYAEAELLARMAAIKSQVTAYRSGAVIITKQASDPYFVR